MQTLTGQYIACVVVSSLCQSRIQWSAYNYFEVSNYYIPGFNHASFAMMSAYVMHFLLLADFMYFYVRAIWKGKRIGGTMDLDGFLPV